MNLTLKSIPEPVYRRLKQLAARNRRSLNSEVIYRLERSIGAAPVDANALLARARVVRERAEVPYLTDEMLREARDEGRA
ncbi:MAG: Arc family DNA-binding protein [Gemmatimonadota bacterium]|nr:Arc family DNA-binding protein [Gemmatimonadota bacterium]